MFIKFMVFSLAMLSAILLSPVLFLQVPYYVLYALFTNKEFKQVRCRLLPGIAFDSVIMKHNYRCIREGNFNLIIRH